MLVDSELELKPVPKRRFLILPASGGEAVEVSTGFEGRIERVLAAGSYRIRVVKPVEFDGRRFSWDREFEIAAGSVTSLELSNDNAQIEELADVPGVTEEGSIYEQYSGGVFKILAAGSHGTGFLIDDEGLVLTNHHVVVESDYLSVECDDRHKYEARVLATDSQRDLAILRLHPDAVAGLPVLRLADDAQDAPPVAVGDRVLAIGNPLTTETILTSGLVSKVEDDSIYSDVAINPGNSGGPLLDLRGRVVGVATFGISGASGPGVSGIVRIHRAESLIEQARTALSGSEPPPARQLPVASIYRFSPDDVRDQALGTVREIEDYHVEAGKIDVLFITPTLVASRIIESEREAARGRQKRKKRKKRKKKDGEPAYEPGQAFYDWQKQNNNFIPVVSVRALPEVKVGLGSAFKSALVGAGPKYRFKTDFGRMEIRRDGEPVEPIHPQRIKQIVHIEGAATFKDIGYYGFYLYPPEAFAPGAKIALSVWEEGVSEPFETELDIELLTRIQVDFAPYFGWKQVQRD